MIVLRDVRFEATCFSRAKNKKLTLDSGVFWCIRSLLRPMAQAGGPSPALSPSPSPSGRQRVSGGGAAFCAGLVEGAADGTAGPRPEGGAHGRDGGAVTRSLGHSL